MILHAFPQPIELRPELAAFLPDTATLVVADLHLGKSAALRARGLALPEDDLPRELDRLTALLAATRARRLVLAGDFFHAPAQPETLAAAEAWFGTLETPVTLVFGNHERKLPLLPRSLATTPRLDLDGLHIVHDPADADPGTPTLCGHHHPVARIADGKRASLRLPCFHLHGRLLTLPASGRFTGGSIAKPTPGDRLFVAPDGEVLEVPADLWR